MEPVSVVPVGKCASGLPYPAAVGPDCVQYGVSAPFLWGTYPALTVHIRSMTQDAACALIHRLRSVEASGNIRAAFASPAVQVYSPGAGALRAVYIDIKQEGGKTMSAKKSILKSVRLTQEVYDFIMSVPGDGFNNKLEKIVLAQYKQKSDFFNEIDELNDAIRERRKVLDDFWSKTLMLDLMIDDLQDIRENLSRLKAYCDVVTDDDTRGEQMPRMDEVPGKEPPDDNLLIL